MATRAARGSTMWPGGVELCGDGPAHRTHMLDERPRRRRGTNSVGGAAHRWQWQPPGAAHFVTWAGFPGLVLPSQCSRARVPGLAFQGSRSRARVPAFPPPQRALRPSVPPPRRRARRGRTRGRLLCHGAEADCRLSGILAVLPPGCARLIAPVACAPCARGAYAEAKCHRVAAGRRAGERARTRLAHLRRRRPTADASPRSPCRVVASVTCTCYSVASLPLIRAARPRRPRAVVYAPEEIVPVCAYSRTAAAARMIGETTAAGGCDAPAPQERTRLVLPYVAGEPDPVRG